VSYAKQLDRRELQAEAGLIPRSMGDRHRQVDSLSKREHDVARLLIEGESNKRIAALLGISPRTAQFHVRRIIAKLGANNRVDAAVTYVRWQFAKERDHRL
jgi:DNA-binding CsgD family transcriptional regulator